MKMTASFQCQILGLIGFSRVCPGYVYEVQFKLGDQKWKSRCKIEVNGQSWIDPEYTFQPSESKELQVKVTEIGTIGKGPMIGSIVCVTKDLICYNPQTFLLPINNSGTVKLKLGIEWRKHDVPRPLVFKKHSTLSSDSVFSELGSVKIRTQQKRTSSSSSQQSASRKEEVNQLITDLNDLARTKLTPPVDYDFYASPRTSNLSKSPVKYENPVNNISTVSDIKLHPNFDSTTNDQQLSHDDSFSGLATLNEKDELSFEREKQRTTASEMDHTNAPLHVLELCNKIVQLLDNKNAQLHDIRSLLLLVKASLTKFRNTVQRRPSLTDSVSSALDTFSFLSDEPAVNYGDNCILILRKQWKACFVVMFHHLCIIHNVIMNDSLIDEVLANHIIFLKVILKISSTPDDITLSKVCEMYTGSGTLSNTWEVSSTEQQPLFSTNESMQGTLTTLFQHSQQQQGLVIDPTVTADVCSLALKKIQEFTNSGVNIVSIFQFVDFFKRIKNHNVIVFLTTVHQEVRVLKALHSKDDLVVLTALQQNIPITDPCIRRVVSLMSSGSSLKNPAIESLVKLSRDPAIRVQLLQLLNHCATYEDLRSGVRGVLAEINKLNPVY